MGTAKRHFFDVWKAVEDWIGDDYDDLVMIVSPKFDGHAQHGTRVTPLKATWSKIHFGNIPS